MIKYFIVDTSETALKMVMNPKTLELYRWSKGAWHKAEPEYSDIFIGEMLVTEIKEGDETWNRLSLQK